MQLETHSAAETVQYMTDIQNDFLKYMLNSYFNRNLISILSYLISPDSSWSKGAHSLWGTDSDR